MLLPHARMREGVKAISLVHLSVCLFVSLSGEKFLNLNIDRDDDFQN